MPVSSASSKVLRVALVRDGRVVMERLLPHDTDLSIGSDPRNALVVPDTPFGTGTTVMTAEDHGYRVLRTDGMAGKLTVHGEPTVLRGDASCAEVKGAFLGISLPAWTGVYFVLLAFGALAGMFGFGAANRQRD